MTPEEASAKLAEVDALLKAINDHVNQVLSFPLLTLIPGAAAVVKWIHDRVADISHTIEGIVGHIVGTITNVIAAAVPTAVDFLLGIVNDVFKDVHDILGNLATAEEFVGGAINEISKHAPKIGELLLGAIGGGIAGGLMDAFKFMEGENRPSIDHLLETILQNPALPPFMHTQVGGLKDRGAPWMALALPFIVAFAIRPLAEASMAPAIVWAEQESQKLFPVREMSVSDLVNALRKGLIQFHQYEDAMGRQGFTKERAVTIYNNSFLRLQPESLTTLLRRGELDRVTVGQQLEQGGLADHNADLLLKATAPLLTDDQIRQTYLRGIIDRPKHDELMAQHGYTQDRINQLVNLYYLIPGPADLIHMGIRNVFDPEIVKTFELGKDSPPEFFRAAAMQGISEDWAAKFWQAHWIVPGEDQAFRMYQRTLDSPLDPNADEITLLDGKRVFNIIGKKTLNLFLKDKDVPPYYREKMTEIAYHPLNRIDIRRMRIVGSLTQAQVQRAYLDLGYSLHNATLLSDFVEKLASQTRKDRAQPYIDGLRRQILTMYVNEKLELSDAAFALNDLGFTPEEADHYFAEVKLIQQAEDALQVEAGIGRLYVSQFITEDDARKRLGVAGTPAKAIDRFIRKWNLQREFRQDTEHFHKMRDLTKAEVTEAYTDKLMSREDADTFLEFLGYPKAEAEIVLNLADYKSARSTRTAMQTAIQAAYVAGVRPLVETSNMLDKLGLPTDRRDALLQEWTLLRETRTEKIPTATLRDLVKTSRLTRADAFVHLKRHRYTDDDANIMLDLWLNVGP